MPLSTATLGHAKTVPGFGVTTLGYAPVITGVSPIVGYPGTVVTIVGQFLDSVTAVKLGGFPASSFTIISSRMIVATV